ncbi:unnamed protein product [Didymodactylos carnosus]|uniref:Peptidase A2 domain-containing protein n=1 Tax=Didymodactylos carnosus TaxID=1234261 RepID=A0A815S591_9BILA|nr:unnamed protein product [Didymodactylos carnosus]CAF4348064.1 unnamed protein product [Didymodactylos carnosus]
MTNASKVDHLFHGLKSSLMKEVFRHAPTTPKEFLKVAKQEEVLEQLVNVSLSRDIRIGENLNDTSATYFPSSPLTQKSVRFHQHYTNDIGKYSSRPSRSSFNSSPYYQPPRLGTYDGRASKKNYPSSLILLNTRIHGRNVRAMEDTGATTSIITRSTLNTLPHGQIHGHAGNITLGDGKTTLRRYGWVDLMVKINGMKTHVRAMIVDALAANFILDRDLNNMGRQQRFRDAFQRICDMTDNDEEEETSRVRHGSMIAGGNL